MKRSTVDIVCVDLIIYDFVFVWNGPDVTLEGALLVTLTLHCVTLEGALFFNLGKAVPNDLNA